MDDTATAAGSVSGTTSATDLQPGVLASAAALLTVCGRAGVPARLGAHSHDARSGAPTHDAWPALLAALRTTLHSAAAMGKESAPQPDAWHDIACALQAACVCLGTARCRDEVNTCLEACNVLLVQWCKSVCIAPHMSLVALWDVIFAHSC